MPNDCGPRCLARPNAAATASRASSHVAGRCAPFSRTRGCVSLSFIGNSIGRFLQLVYPKFLWIVFVSIIIPRRAKAGYGGDLAGHDPNFFSVPQCLRGAKVLYLAGQSKEYRIERLSTLKSAIIVKSCA